MLSHYEFDVAATQLKNAARLMQGRALVREFVVDGKRQVCLDVPFTGTVQHLSDIHYLVALRQAIGGDAMVSVSDRGAALFVHGQESPIEVDAEVIQ